MKKRSFCHEFIGDFQWQICDRQRNIDREEMLKG
uniref:Uncharacterized protein n=1 Tax=Rhizophora mucronata TaxID=61149 RepID=A0A2P2MZJ2_RHIMU